MASRNKYERLPTKDGRDPALYTDTDVDIDVEGDPTYREAALAAQRVRSGQYDRFNPPPPAPWKRAALIFFMIALFIIAWKLRAPSGPEVIHAERYSEKYKYRPAASPVITEKLKNGKLLVRGAFRNEL